LSYKFSEKTILTSIIEIADVTKPHNNKHYAAFITNHPC